MAHSFFEAAHGHVDNELVPGAELHALTSVNDDAHLFDFVRDDDLRRLQVLEVVVHLVLLLFRLVLGVLAPGLILDVLTTAPPYLATPLAAVRPTAPVEVLFLNVVFGAVFANLLGNVELALPLLELLDPVAHLFALRHKVLLLFF